MKIPLSCLAMCMALFVAACSYNAQLTTTAGSESASVDVPAHLDTDMTVTSTNVATGTLITAANGVGGISLSVPALTTGTAPAVFKKTPQSVALEFNTDITSYTQTLGSMLQTELPKLVQSASVLSSLTQEANSLASSWGMTPVNSKQQGVFNSVVANIAKVGQSANQVESYLTQVQTGITVPVLTAFYEPAAPKRSRGPYYFAPAKPSPPVKVKVHGGLCLL